MNTWIEDESGICHVDGVAWWDAAVPRRWHRCKPQTFGCVGIETVERCACGAIRNPRFGAGWSDRNARRRLPPVSEEST